MKETKSAEEGRDETKYPAIGGEDMPKFLDAHPFKPFTEKALRQAQNAPKDEFGVTHHNILYNQKEDKLFCLLEAPNKEAVENHHKKAGVKCDWIIEVDSTK